MKTLLSLIAAALALSACASTAMAPASYYRAAGETTQHAIGGTLRQTAGLGSPSNEVTITIDGTPVCRGEFSGGAVTLDGAFQGRPVSADCSAVAAGSIGHMLMWGTDRTDVHCIVSIAGERAAHVALIPE